VNFASVQHEDRSKPGLHRFPSKKITHAPLGADCEAATPADTSTPTIATNPHAARVRKPPCHRRSMSL
jgi:hypothetical protein